MKAGEKLRTWVPVRSFTHTLEEQYAIYDNIEILVEIELTCSTTDLVHSVNDSMSDVFVYNRSITGAPDQAGQPSTIPRFQTHRQVIADCYEWMWHIGFTGHDPLILDHDSPSHRDVGMMMSGAENFYNQVGERDSTAVKSYSDDRASADVIEIQKSLSASDIVPALHDLEDPSKPDSGKFKSVGASRNLSIHRRRSSRLRIVNRAGAPDSDDEVEDYSDETTYETRKSIFDSYDAAVSPNSSPAQLSAKEVPITPPPPSDQSPLATSPPRSDSFLSSSPNRSHVPPPPPASTPSAQSKSANPTESGAMVRSRIDYSYSLDWIRQHIAELSKLLDDVKSYLPDIKRKIRSEKAFRSSVFKKEPLLQPMPTNLHYQILGIRKHCVACIDAHPKNTEILHSITSGALTPHVLGHKSGGLYHQESLLIKLKDEIRSQKEKYLAKLKHFGDNGIRTDSIHSPFHLLQSLGKSVLEFENSSINLGRRRMLAISQGLAIAMNAFLLKLHLLIEGHIPFPIALRWLDAGFLILFEGLLSVVGNERSMLEDTISAVDALRAYQVRLVPNHSDAEEDRGRQSSRQASNEAEEAIKHAMDVEFEMKGREIVVYMSDRAVKKLPPEFQTGIAKSELFVKFFPVLFTQVCDTSSFSLIPPSLLSVPVPRRASTSSRPWSPPSVAIRGRSAR